MPIQGFANTDNMGTGKKPATHVNNYQLNRQRINVPRSIYTGSESTDNNTVTRVSGSSIIDTKIPMKGIVDGNDILTDVTIREITIRSKTTIQTLMKHFRPTSKSDVRIGEGFPYNMLTRTCIRQCNCPITTIRNEKTYNKITYIV